MKLNWNNLASNIPYWVVVSLFILGIYRIHGSKMSYGADAVYYNIAANMISQGEGFCSNTASNPTRTTPITHYMPVYSVVLSVAKLVSAESPLRAIHAVNYSFLLFYVIIWLVLLNSLFRERKIFAALGGFGLLLMPSTWLYATTSMSEPVFMALLALGLHLATRYQRAAQHREILLHAMMLALVGSAVALTRKVGIALAISLALVLAARLFLARAESKPSHAKALFVFLGLSGFLVGGWLLRNHIYKNNLFAGQNMTELDAPEKLVAILRYFVIDTLGLPSSLEVLSFLILAWLALGLFMLFRQEAPLAHELAVVLAFLLVYVGGITTFSLLVNFPTRSGGFMRYFYVLQPYLMLILLYLIYKINTGNDKKRVAFKWLTVMLLVGSVLSNGHRSRLFFDGLQLETAPIDEYALIRKALEEARMPLVFANTYQETSIYTGRYCKQIGKAGDVQRIMAMPEIHYTEAFVVLRKGDGDSSASVERILSGLEHEVLLNNDKVIFAKIVQEP